MFVHKIKKFIKRGVMFWLLFAISPAGNAVYIQLEQSLDFDGSSWRIISGLYDWFGEDSYPNPCYRAAACELGLQLYFTQDLSNLRPYGGASWFAKGAWVSNAENLGDLGKALRKNVSLPVERVLYSGAVSPGREGDVPVTCMVYRVNGGAQQHFVNTCINVVGGGGAIGTWCEPKGGAITFNYGVIESSEVNGQTRSAPYSLWCNRTVTAKVYAKNLSGGRLYLSGDRRLYADLTIDGNELGTGITKVFREGVTSSYTIKSTLGSSGEIQAGEFSGSTVVYIDIQ
ncbi:hypothetical protein HAP49_20435 [Serratia marcescens]|uniref:MrpH family fimbial adhesin n=1 Tax=Serratia marcescens TaxID=615 RepID=UPI00140769B7|nr:hypothetical protein [Serratia marcescens]QIO29364.1 hypothetical protein HAP49_20435 [Serratia marcescens]HCR2978023.1 hypothetical protein [Serratia marcescens]